MSNSTCFSPKAPQEGPPLFQHGKIVFQAHDVGWLVTGLFTIVATVTSLWLVNKHLQWYTNKREQRFIVRILFMVPIYAWISFASYLFWNHSTPLLLIRDGYESTVLTAFFYLLLMYLSPSADEQKAIFLKVGISRQADREARRKGQEVRKWMIPLSFIKAKPMDGLYFLQIMKWGVLQYCVIRPTTTLVAVILNYFGWYCTDSLSPRWGHVYITVTVSVSVSIAMYCLLQLYLPIAGHLAPHKPILKLFAVKAVVFLTFWQSSFLSGLSMIGVVKDTQFMTADDINTGLSAILETFEMMIFAFLYIRAFSYKPYQPPYHPNQGDSYTPNHTPRLRSLGHAFDFRETFRELWIGCVYILDRTRGVEPRPDMGARRMAMMEDVFGRARLWDMGSQRKKTLGVAVEVSREINVDVGGERQWLGTGDDYAYGLGYASRRERSDGLGEAIEKELDKRGVRLRDADVDRGLARTNYVESEQLQGHDRRGQRTSWWRSMYDRLSLSGADPADDKYTKPSRRYSRSQHHSRNFDHTSLLYDAPPPSIIQARCSNRQSLESRSDDLVTNNDDVPAEHVQEPTDVLGPLPTSKRHSLPARSGSSTPLISSSQFDRSDSLLARVFPHNSPGISSTELSSAASVSSRSTHNRGGRASLAKLHLMTNTSVIITPGDDPGRALLSSPVPLQMLADDVSNNDVASTPCLRQLQLLSTSVESDMAPPPVPPKLSSFASDGSPKRHKSPRHSDTHVRLSHRRESAGHRPSHVSGSYRPSALPSPLNSPSTTSRAGDITNDNFDVMNGYVARKSDPQMQGSVRPMKTLDSSDQFDPATEQAVSLTRQVAYIYKQQFAIVGNRHSYSPGVSRQTYTRPTRGTHSHHCMSAPLEIASQSITKPTATHSRIDHRSRHSTNGANICQLTVPAPLAPRLPTPETKLIRDTHNALSLSVRQSC